MHQTFLLDLSVKGNHRSPRLTMWPTSHQRPLLVVVSLSVMGMAQAVTVHRISGTVGVYLMRINSQGIRAIQDRKWVKWPNEAKQSSPLRESSFRCPRQCHIRMYIILHNLMLLPLQVLTIQMAPTRGNRANSKSAIHFLPKLPHSYRLRPPQKRKCISSKTEKGHRLTILQGTIMVWMQWVI
jgi:hypothetical protein